MVRERRRHQADNSSGRRDEHHGLQPVRVDARHRAQAPGFRRYGSDRHGTASLSSRSSPPQDIDHAPEDCSHRHEGAAIESAAAIKDFVAKNASVLAKIEGGYQFAVIESGANWKKTVLYDAKGTLVSTTDAGLSNGQIITQKTVLADGTIDVVKLSNGTKTNETFLKTDGTKQT